MTSEPSFLRKNSADLGDLEKWPNLHCPPRGGAYGRRHQRADYL